MRFCLIHRLVSRLYLQRSSLKIGAPLSPSRVTPLHIHIVYSCHHEAKPQSIQNTPASDPKYITDHQHLALSRPPSALPYKSAQKLRARPPKSLEILATQVLLTNPAASPPARPPSPTKARRISRTLCGEQINQTTTKNNLSTHTTRPAHPPAQRASLVAD